MRDEVDTTARWLCPACGEVLETDYAQMQMKVAMHELKCPAKKTNNKKKNRDKERR